MKLVTLLVTSTCASIILSGCGKAEDSMIHPEQTQAEKPIVQNDSVSTKKLKPKLKPVSVQKPPAQKALTIWDTSIAFDRTNLMSLYLKDSPELIGKREFMEYEACSVSPSGRFNSMSKNEFSYEDFLSEIQSKTKARIEDLDSKHHLSSGKPYLIKVRTNATLGDYDFENETFAFIPISFDFLQEGNELSSRCQYKAERIITRPDPWPNQFHFYFENKNAVQSFAMSKAEAKTLIDRMTETGNTWRNVDFDFIFALEPDAMKFIPARSEGRGHVEARVRIIQAKIVARKRRQKPLLIAEYPKSFFE
jgi:hypothetical protein